VVVRLESGCACGAGIGESCEESFEAFDGGGEAVLVDGIRAVVGGAVPGIPQHTGIADMQRGESGRGESQPVAPGPRGAGGNFGGMAWERAAFAEP